MKIIKILVSIIVVFLLIIFFWKLKTEKRLIFLDQNVKTSFQELVIEKSSRLKKLNSIVNLDSLISLNKNSLRLKTTLSDSISFEYLDNEFLIDSTINSYIQNHNKGLVSIKSNCDNILNNRISQYNQALKEYYQYRLFPKSILAKRLGIKDKMYFEFEYGNTNERPSIEEARVAAEIDSILIDGLK